MKKARILLVLLIALVFCGIEPVSAIDYTSPDIVKMVQSALSGAGFYDGAIDGDLGPMTQESISEYRKAVGLPEGTDIDKELISTVTSKNHGLPEGYTPSVISTPTVTPIPVPQEGLFETYLSAGIYTAGLDIPAGRYNLVAYSGRGNVISKAGVNEIMGYPADDHYIDRFNGLSLSNGDKLKIGGTLVLFVHSDNAKINNMGARQIMDEYEVYLSPGNYIAGIDFPIGVYNVVGSSGSGNVICRDADLNEIFSTVNDDHYIVQFNNAAFKEGSELEVSGCSITLVPVGR